MSSIHSNTRSRLGLAALCLGILAFAGNCTLGPLQALLFHFTIDQTVAAGTTQEVHTAYYPAGVTLNKYWVRLSGHLDVKGETPPSRITVNLQGEDRVSGKVNHKLTLQISIKDDGSFSATKKIKKNIAAGTVQTITANPAGADIPAGSEVWVCVDIAKNKGDLAAASDCHGGTDGMPTGEVHVVAIGDNDFDPKRVRLQAGDTVRWVLRGSSASHTTTAMETTWDSGFVFSEIGDFFEHTFDASTNNQTFRYYCRTHQGCCQMQGSVLVGDDAPDPGPDY